MSEPSYTHYMRVNHEACPRCGLWHSSMSCAPQFQVQSQIIDSLRAENERREKELQYANIVTMEMKHRAEAAEARAERYGQALWEANSELGKTVGREEIEVIRAKMRSVLKEEK